MAEDSPTILIAEDHPDDVRAIFHALKEDGYRLVTVHDGAEAIEAATRSKPDLLILDAMMPKRNGFEVTRTLRGQPETRDIPIIMLTVLRTEDAAARSFDAGADDYVVKPIVPSQLRACVHTWLLRRAQAS